MSEATIFEFPYNLFLKERLEFVVICQDELEAKIMRVIEYGMIKLKEAWQEKCELATDAKKPLPREPRDYWVRLSHSMIIARLYLYDSATLIKPETEDMESAEWKEYLAKKALSISKSTLRKAINSLIAKGFLVMRSKPGDEFGAPIYTLHHAHVQKAISALPSNPYTIFHRGGVTNFESGGVTNSTPGGESQNVELPLPNIETPTSKTSNSQLQDLNINIDSTLDSSLETPEREGEGTGDFTSVQSPPARAETFHSEISEARERTNHALEVSTAFNAETWDPEQTVTANDRCPPFTKEQFRASSSNGDVTQATTHVQNTPGRQFKTPTLRLTERGAVVKGWLEDIGDSTISQSFGNIGALNALGANPDVSFDSLKRTIALLEALQFVKDHDIAVDVQLLAGDTRLNFEKNWPTARKKQRAGPQESDTPRAEPEGYYPDYGESLDAQIERELADYHRREEARSAAKERGHHEKRPV